MTHVISKEKGFAFIHIPKNGGSTIRKTYLQFDDCGEKFAFKIVEHDELGRIALGHVPLWVIARYYPDDFEAIRTNWSCAITRDPVERFRSALGQRSRQFLGLDLHALSKAQLSKQIDVVIAHLETHETLPEAEFCHFARQSDFVFLDTEKVVKNVFPLAQMNDLLKELSQKTGVEPVKKKANASQTVTKGTLGWTLRTGWHVLKPAIPKGARTKLRKRFRSLAVTSSTKQPLAVGDEKVIAFVRDFYARDFDIHKEACTRGTHITPELVG